MAVLSRLQAVLSYELYSAAVAPHLSSGMVSPSRRWHPRCQKLLLAKSNSPFSNRKQRNLLFDYYLLLQWPWSPESTLFGPFLAQACFLCPLTGISK